MTAEQTRELVLPRAFAEYLEGCDLLATENTRGNEIDAHMLRAWKASTLRRGCTVLKIDDGEAGTNVLDFVADYADMAINGDRNDFTRSERTAARTVLNRIDNLHSQRKL